VDVDGVDVDSADVDGVDVEVEVDSVEVDSVDVDGADVDGVDVDGVDVDGVDVDVDERAPPSSRMSAEAATSSLSPGAPLAFARATVGAVPMSDCRGGAEVLLAERLGGLTVICGAGAWLTSLSESESGSIVPGFAEGVGFS
jgi:hypothetical protein